MATQTADRPDHRHGPVHEPRAGARRAGRLPVGSVRARRDALRADDGAHPFKRETAVQTLSAIIAEEPPDPAQTNPALPVALRWLIRRLLAKNPRQRFAHTSGSCRRLAHASASICPKPRLDVPPAVERSPWRWHRVAALGALFVSASCSAGRSHQPVHASGFEKFTPFATDEGYQGAPVWSPDGKTIAYEAEVNGVVQIFTRTVGSSMRTRVTNSRFDCFISTWSADGTSISTLAHETRMPLARLPARRQCRTDD